MVNSLKNFKITFKKLLSSLLNFVRVFEFAHSLIIRKFVTFISWQNWCSGSISGCDHRELGSNPVGGGKWRRSFEMEVESLESEREVEPLELERKVDSFMEIEFVPLEFKSWCQKFHHMMKSFFSKILFFDYKVLLEIYNVLNIFSKVLKEVW